jgi:hypothetical protein
MAYIGKTPVIGNFQICDAITVVDAQAAYTMQVGGVNVSPESANHMLVSLNGILQAPTSSFTVSGSTITFASALETGDVIDFIQILGNVLDLGVPSDNTVTTAKLSDSSVTTAKLNDASVSLAKLTATGTKDATTFLRGDNTFAEAGGGLNLIKSQTASSAASVEFVNGTNGVVFDGTYPLYYLIGYDIYNSTITGEPEIHITTDTGSTYKTTGYKTVKRRLLEASGSISIDGTGVSTDHIGASFLNSGTDSSYAFSFHAYFFNPSNVTTRPSVFSEWQPSASNYTSGYTIMRGIYDTAGAYDGFRIEPNGGTINGTFKLYGIKGA